MNERTFYLKPKPPVRAFLLAAVASLIGAVALVLALQFGWHWIVVLLFSGILLVGILLAVAGVVAMARLGMKFTVDDDGYRITGTDAEHKGSWDDVTRVTRANNGDHITIFHGPKRRTHLLFPGGSAATEIEEISAEIAKRLTANENRQR